MAYNKSEQTISYTGFTINSKPKLAIARFYTVKNDDAFYVGSVDGILKINAATDEITKLYGGAVNTYHSAVPMLATDNGVFFFEDFIDGANILFVDNGGKINRDYEYLANGFLRYGAKLVSYDGTTLKYHLWHTVASGMGYGSFDV